MSKPTRKKGHNGNGRKNGHNGNGHKNGHNGNGNGHKNGTGNGKKPTARKPAGQLATSSGTRAGASSNGMIVRRNSPPMRTRSSSEPEPERTPMLERIEDMGASHVAAAATAGALATAVHVAVVGQGVMGSKTTAAVTMGLGAATAAYGAYSEHDHVMMAGAGIASAGAFSLANQLAIDGYQGVEKKAEERKAKKEAEEKAKKTRNARITVQDSDADEDDYAHREFSGDDFDEYDAEPS